jgi:hypothetical protein
VKLETVTNLYFVLAVFVPGFVYGGVVSQFVPLRQSGQNELILLRLLTATAFNYALCSPLIYLLTIGALFARAPIPHAITWFAIIFIVPSLLGLARARMIQHDSFPRLYRLVGLRPINPVPTGWDWIFGRTGPCYVLVTLVDGTEIAGWFGHRSMASSDPERRDIYIERVYTVPDTGEEWQEVPDSSGVYIEGSQIAFIEFMT